MKRSLSLSLIALFAALNVACDAIVIPQLSSSVWYGLIFLLEPINGIVLGPYTGALSTLIGVLAGHIITPRGFEEFLFTLGAPVGAMVSGFVFRGKLKTIFFYYAALLAFFFATPVSWQLPFYGMWDVYLAFISLLFMIVIVNRKGSFSKKDNIRRLLVLSAFIGLEADILFRIFIFIPGQTYRWLYGIPVDVLQIIWVTGAFITPIKVAVSIVLTTIVGRQVIKILNEHAT